MNLIKRPFLTNQQSLPDMSEGNFISIDKTLNIYDLIKNKNYFFLLRLRRFGKTLLVSTKEEIFSENRSLFRNLAMTSTDYEWTHDPVIVIRFATLAALSAAILRQAIDEMLDDSATRYDITLKAAATLGTTFKSLILQMAKKIGWQFSL